jgi:hypothetical protein
MYVSSLQIKLIVLWLIGRVFPPPSQSYYCLLKVNSEDADKEEKQYLVCFLSIGKEGLDLYPHDQNSNILGHWMVHGSPLASNQGMKFGARLVSSSV